MNSGRISIAVDARPLTSPVSGVSRMISRIIEHLPDEDLQFHLFASRNWHRDFDELLKQHNVIWNQSFGLTARKPGVWYNTSFPIILNRMKPSIYWGTQQTVPAFFSGRTPSILTFHDFVSYRFPGAMRWTARLQQKALQRKSISLARRIIANSRQTAEEVRRFFNVEPERLRIGYPGFDPPPSDRKRRASLPISIQTPYILSVSTIEPRKNYAMLIEAYLRYHRSTSSRPYSLVLAGRRGWESPAFFRRLEEIQQETGSVFLLEGLRDDQIAELYEEASFFCFPSIYEGFGIPLLEALCHGKVAVVSDLGVFHEIAGDSAIYLPDDDADAWARTIEQTVQRHQEGELQQVDFDCRKWNWARTAAVYREAFRELAS